MSNTKVPLVEQDLFTVPENLISHSVFLAQFVLLNMQVLCVSLCQPLLYPRSTGGGIYCFTSVRPSVCLSFRPSQDIFRRIFLNNYWWQKSYIWSQASYRYPISWKAFLDPSHSYFLFADLVGFYTHWTCMRGYHKWALDHSSSCLSFFPFSFGHCDVYPSQFGLRLLVTSLVYLLACLLIFN